MENELLFLGLGTLAGAIVSFLGWWFSAHYIVPVIKFSEDIQKRPSKSHPAGYYYRIKIQNIGRRTAIDLTVRVRLGLYAIGAPDTWNWYDIPTGSYSIPRILGRDNRLFILRPFDSESFDKKFFPENVRRKRLDGSLTIEDLFSSATKAKMIVYIFAYDSFSGARKLFLSKAYKASDIKLGKFDNLVLVEEEEVPSRLAS